MTDENLLNADIPEKFRDRDTGAVRVDALAQSYRELEKRLSQSPSVPESPEAYCISCDHGMFASDPEINARLHARGFTQEQAQEVYNLAAEKMVPMILELVAEFQADREVEKLINHFGGPDRWKDVSRQLLSFGLKNLPAEVLDSLSSSYEGVLALHRMMKGEEPSLRHDMTNGPTRADARDLSAMMRDPRYWKERDPAYVAKVTQGFQDLYRE